jgi:spermidine/putrescine transport system permease protein
MAEASANLKPAPEIHLNRAKIRFDLTMRQLGKIALYLNPIAMYFFLWAPIVLLVVFSFNSSRSLSRIDGFTFEWYQNIFTGVMGTEARFSTQTMLGSLWNSLIVGFFSTVISTTIGTTVALSLARGNFPGKRYIDGLLLLPVVIPEITQGVSLAAFFSIIFQFMENQMGVAPRPTPGLGTIIIAHVAFSISYVAIVVRARLADMNPRLEEAARDLGANEWLTFWRVTFPLLLPGIISGALLAFTLSLDDFVITFFTAGVGSTTLPIFVYGLLKLSVTPEINAISTIILIVSTVLIGISLTLQGGSTRR